MHAKRRLIKSTVAHRSMLIEAEKNYFYFCLRGHVYACTKIKKPLPADHFQINKTSDNL